MAMDHERIANDLLMPIWRGIPSDYKMRYSRNIWQQFEDNVRSAAYTSKLTTWLDDICRKINVSIPSVSSASVQLVIASGEDRSILKALRDETTYLVLLVRVANDERKASMAQEDLF